MCQQKVLLREELRDIRDTPKPGAREEIKERYIEEREDSSRHVSW